MESATRSATAHTRFEGWLQGVAALRARQWVHFAVLPAVAWTGDAADLPRIALACAAASAALAYAYGLNAIADRHGDASADKNPLVDLPRLPASVPVAVAATAALALALALVVGAVAVAAIAGSLCSATFYSVRPRLKALPVAGLALNTGIFAPLLAVGLDAAAPPPAFAALTVAFCALLIQNQLLHERADADEDARARVWTTARLLGARATTAIVAGLAVPAAAAAVWLAPSPAVAAAVVGAIVAGAIAGVTGRAAPARRRAIHRWVSLAGGAIAWAVAIAEVTR